MSETNDDVPEAIEPPSGNEPTGDGAGRATGWGAQGPWSTPPGSGSPPGAQPPPGDGPPTGYQQPPGYGPPPGYGYGYGAGYGYASPPPFAKPANNLVSAILATVLCCLPLGVVAIVFAAQVDTKWASGDWYGAQDSAKKAKLFANLSVAGAVAGIVLYIFIAVMAGSSRTRF